MKNFRRTALCFSLLAGLGFGTDPTACTTDGWLGGNSGVPANANPASPPSVARYSELCALAVTNTSYVQDNNASDTRYRARFYVLDGLTGADPIDIFVAYSNEGATTTLFKVAFNGSQFTFNATGAGGGSASAASVNGWNLVEFDWNSGVRFVMPVEEGGDVRARLMLRAREAEQSLAILRQALEALPEGPVRAEVPDALPRSSSALGWAEGWRGECLHWIQTDAAGRLARVKVTDPSSKNWPGLARAVPSNILPDFPVINKSFNLSYSGNDR